MFVDTKVRPQGEQVDAIAPNKMKLSEAIRIGAKLRPQGFGKPSLRQGTSCAMQAALEVANGMKPVNPDEAGRVFVQYFGDRYEHVVHEVISRNDRGQSREQVADWLEAQGL